MNGAVRGTMIPGAPIILGEEQVSPEERERQRQRTRVTRSSLALANAVDQLQAAIDLGGLEPEEAGKVQAARILANDQLRSVRSRLDSLVPGDAS